MRFFARRAAWFPNPAGATRSAVRALATGATRSATWVLALCSRHLGQIVAHLHRLLPRLP